MSQSDTSDNREGDQSHHATEGNQPWHRPPMITPNFGKRKKIGLKSNINKVLLHDNVSQAQVLKVQLSNLHIEERRSSKLLELHKKSFLVQQSIKQQHLRSIGIQHLSILPDNIANVHGGMSKYRDAQGRTGKDVTFDLSDDNNDIDPSSVASSKPSSAHSRSNRSSSPLPDILAPAQAARSHSAVEPTENTTNFMTHNYHMRREKTVAVPASCARRDLKQQLQKKPIRALKDPRYISLKKTLVPCGKSMDGYLQLSASGQYVLQRYGKPSVDQEYVQKLVREMTMIRQSRLNSRCGSSIVGNSRRPSAISAAGGQRVNRLVINHDGSQYAESYDGD